MAASQYKEYVIQTSMIKFPKTPYLFWLNSTACLKKDRLLSAVAANRFLSNDLVLEEKIDGANLSLSFDVDGNLLLYNRGSRIHLDCNMNTTCTIMQWAPLKHWLSLRQDLIFDVISDNYVIFGEWCYARHTIKYNLLPDWFIGFDVYDKKSKIFLASDLRDKILEDAKLQKVPWLFSGKVDLQVLLNLLKQKSKFSNEKVEGIYLRREGCPALLERAKLVNGDFIQNIGMHWQKRELEKNTLINMYV